MCVNEKNDVKFLEMSKFNKIRTYRGESFFTPSNFISLNWYFLPFKDIPQKTSSVFRTVNIGNHK